MEIKEKERFERWKEDFVNKLKIELRHVYNISGILDKVLQDEKEA